MKYGDYCCLLVFMIFLANIFYNIETDYPYMINDRIIFENWIGEGIDKQKKWTGIGIK